ncbi:DUF2157 domain-containing protein [Amphibiibacter pelophylacis]|uniref:DUF2157 domain-containing protein n=1 Tax=Amphibiibacter pelophylacis TaxID=1799477 RepID=A0ACC6P1A7_9BURK
MGHARTVNIDRHQLDAAARAGLIAPGQAEGLWQFLAAQQGSRATLRLTHVLYHLGGLIAIGAMTLFMTLAWERLDGWGIAGLALLLAAGALLLAEALRRRDLLLPTGLTAALAVALTPLAVCGVQKALGLWPTEGWPASGFENRWLPMEAATVLTGLLALWRYRLPFLVLPIAIALWALSQDAAPLFLGASSSDLPWGLHERVSLALGLALILTAVWVDVRTRRTPDFAFWLHLAGASAFWVGLSLMSTGSDLARFVYLGLNVVMVLGAALLLRRVYAVFGALGITAYLAWLAQIVFANSLLFPLALAAIGLGVMALGIVWQRCEAQLARRLSTWLPERWQGLGRHGS